MAATHYYQLQRHDPSMHGKCRGRRTQCLYCSSIQARNLVPKRSAFEGSGWPPAKVIEEKEAKPLRSEINEAVKLNVPAFAEPY